MAWTNMSDSSDTLFEFPCDFPIKVFGETGEAFESKVFEIVAKHVENLNKSAFKKNASKKGKYTSITITIRATSKQQIDDIYIELTASKHVVMAL